MGYLHVQPGQGQGWPPNLDPSYFDQHSFLSPRTFTIVISNTSTIDPLIPLAIKSWIKGRWIFDYSGRNQMF